jgi:S1-C subfamily serine protease
MDDPNRRQFLTFAGTAALSAFAGCSGLPVGGQDTERNSATRTTTEPLADGASVYSEVYRESIGSVTLIRAFLPSGQSQGSGWVYDDSHVVTNHHVVDEAEEVEVQFHDGTWADAEIVGSDLYSDLAVLRIDQKPDVATPLPLFDGDPPVGERVVAIGNPYGFEGSMSEGIVSGVNRYLPSVNGVPIPDTIQTDAAVNPGNSGGPLLTLDGRVVGVVNAGGGENIAFAISAELLQRVVPALIADGTYSHPALGVALTNVTPTTARVNDLDEPRGVMVIGVVRGSPAHNVLTPATETTEVAGVTVPVGGDVIVGIEETAIPTEAAYATYLALNERPGERVMVAAIRDGEPFEREIVLATRAGTFA